MKTARVFEAVAARRMSASDGAAILMWDDACRTRQRARLVEVLGTVAIALALLLVPALLSGCARPLDTAITAANAAHDVGDAAAAALDAGCTQRYLAARVADVPAIDKVCIPVGHAYSAYRTAHAALVAGIQAAEGGALTTGDVLALAARLAASERTLAASLGALR